MNFKDLRSATSRVTTIAFYIGFGIIAIVNTVIILAAIDSTWDKVKSLGLTYLILGIAYGIFRFLRYMNSD